MEFLFLFTFTFLRAFFRWTVKVVRTTAGGVRRSRAFPTAFLNNHSEFHGEIHSDTLGKVRQGKVRQKQKQE
ncbi:hypothetical protein FPQ18DRAFT_322345 [Pyronema domesticum]|uniref:Uncharacterized protein n=1 Tax=Pyronema omphalodes (strain CBS 100304) TaxID=1076935 RepID=U4KXT3_PYROM|nr:hypothetical protein FPQ18DRAFT_322345 [Pyronema domesticum]CCX06656.1 Protein of unknown function [Pyronema omphalodes CBS 100304]